MQLNRYVFSSSVSAPYLSNPDPAKNLNPDPVPEPSYEVIIEHFKPFLSPWIRIPNPDPEDPWIRIQRTPASGSNLDPDPKHCSSLVAHLTAVAATRVHILPNIVLRYKPRNGVLSPGNIKRRLWLHKLKFKTRLPGAQMGWINEIKNAVILSS